MAFDAPVMGFVFVHEDMLPWSAMDAGLMLQTLFLSAKSRGIDSCPVGILATWRAPVDEEFEIPEGYKFITGFALATPIRTRRSIRCRRRARRSSSSRQVTLRAIHLSAVCYAHDRHNEDVVFD